MDWPRAKNLLIAAFLLLNIFLYSEYVKLAEARDPSAFRVISVESPVTAPHTNGLPPNFPGISGGGVQPEPGADSGDAATGSTAGSEDTETNGDQLPPRVSESEQLRLAGVDILPVQIPSTHEPLSLLHVRLQHPRGGELARSLFGTSEKLEISFLPGGTHYRFVEEELTVFDLGYIRYENKQEASSRTAHSLNEPIMSRRLAALETAREFLKRLPPLEEDMVLDEINAVDPFTDVVRYVQVFSGLPIFGTLNGRPVGGYVQLTIRNGRVVLFEKNRLEVVQVSGAPKKLITPTEAMLQLVRQVSRPAYGFTIQDIVLGYFAGAYREASSWESVPAWRIRLREGTSYYVNAYTGLLEHQTLAR